MEANAYHHYLRTSFQENAYLPLLVWGLDDRGIVVRSLAGTTDFHFCKTSRLALGPTQPPTQWDQAVLSSGSERPGFQNDHMMHGEYNVKSDLKFEGFDSFTYLGAIVNNEIKMWIDIFSKIMTECRA
jgi:hypothetical protein